MTTVLIPAFRPGAALLEIIVDLHAARPGWAVVVVDDGSGPEYAGTFAAVRRLGADVVALPANRGKGVALRVGLGHIGKTRPGSGVVTADADGQHAVPDIIRVGEAIEEDCRRIVLGARAFAGDVPLRSRVGNTATRWLFAVATRRRITDTQTGLRGLPAGLLPWAGAVPGDRYDYELRMLLAASRGGIDVREVEITTIYLDGNSSSHFRPVVDSARIYLPLLAFLCSSLAAFVIDVVALLALTAATGHLLLSVLGARLVSAGVNFAVNRRLVFDPDGRTPTGRAVRRYALLAAAVVTLNYLLLASLTWLGMPLLLAKLLTEASLVALSFAAQRHFVFASGTPAPARGDASQPPHKQRQPSRQVDRPQS